MKVVKIGGISESNLGDDPGPRTTGDGGKGTRGPVDVEGGGGRLAAEETRGGGWVGLSGNQSPGMGDCGMVCRV
jgi:hypothetical protein